MINLSSILNSYNNRTRIIVSSINIDGLEDVISEYSSSNSIDYICWTKISKMLKNSDHILSSIMKESDKKNIRYPIDLISDLIIEDHIMQAEKRGRGWILSGYPKNKEEFDCFSKKMLEKNIDISKVIAVKPQNDHLCNKFWYKDDILPLFNELYNYKSKDEVHIINEEEGNVLDSLSSILKEINTSSIEINSNIHWQGAWFDCLVETALPIKNGVDYKIAAFKDKLGEDIHFALIYGDVNNQENVPVRIHSSCITGDIFSSLKCDCGSQLDHALNYIKSKDRGVLIYLMQEGRGIGIVNKLKAYQLQDNGVDTLDANRMLNLPDDAREYHAAVDIIKYLNIESVSLITNNPLKVKKLLRWGISVSGTEYASGCITEQNKKYLETKKQKMSHSLEV